MRYDLVFEGGGAKGMVFVGAMRAFEREGHRPGRLLGTSAGAITATLLACGYSAEEMAHALAEREGERSVFASFMGTPEPADDVEVRKSVVREMLHNIDIPFLPDSLEEKLDDKLAEWLATYPGLRHLFSFVEHGGWYSAAAFERWMTRQLNSGTFRGARRAFGGLTLKHYYEATGAELSLIASDITGQAMLVLNHRTAPEVPVVSAVRMSMNIPLLWQEVVWQPSWGAYRGHDLSHHAVVDGGLLSNFPLALFVTRAEAVLAVVGPSTADGVLGMLIDETAAVPGIAAKPEETGLGLLRLRTGNRLRALADTALGARDKVVIDAFERLVVRLPAQGFGTTEFDMEPARRDALVKAGEEALSLYLAQRDDDAVSFGTGPDPAERAADKLAVRILK